VNSRISDRVVASSLASVRDPADFSPTMLSICVRLEARVHASSEAGQLFHEARGQYWQALCLRQRSGAGPQRQHHGWLLARRLAALPADLRLAQATQFLIRLIGNRRLFEFFYAFLAQCGCVLAAGLEQ